jgi:hypothetical protein
MFIQYHDICVIWKAAIHQIKSDIRHKKLKNKYKINQQFILIFASSVIGHFQWYFSYCILWWSVLLGENHRPAASH